MKRYFAIAAVLALLSWPMLSAAEDETTFPPEANWDPTPAYQGITQQVQGRAEVAELQSHDEVIMPPEARWDPMPAYQAKEVVAELKDASSDVARSGAPSEQSLLQDRYFNDHVNNDE
jgi:hypothetical protein